MTNRVQWLQPLSIACTPSAKSTVMFKGRRSLHACLISANKLYGSGRETVERKMATSPKAVGAFNHKRQHQHGRQNPDVGRIVPPGVADQAGQGAQAEKNAQYRDPTSAAGFPGQLGIGRIDCGENKQKAGTAHGRNA